MRSALIGLLSVILVPAAAASTWVTNDAAAPTLQVDASGNALVSWTDGGAKHGLLLPPTGKVVPEGHLSGPDVGRSSTVSVPFARVVRSGRHGWMYALQTWPPATPGGAVELHVSRWRGAPTAAQLTASKTSTGVVLSGSVMFAGRPIPTTSRTPAGKTLRAYAYLDVQTGSGWRRLGGTAIRTDGTFRRLVPDTRPGARFRVLVEGPNIGSTYAPDALATTVYQP